MKDWIVAEVASRFMAFRFENGVPSPDYYDPLNVRRECARWHMDAPQTEASARRWVDTLNSRGGLVKIG